MSKIKINRVDTYTEEGKLHFVVPEHCLTPQQIQMTIRRLLADLKTCQEHPPTKKVERLPGDPPLSAVIFFPLAAFSPFSTNSPNTL